MSGGNTSPKGAGGGTLALDKKSSVGAVVEQEDAVPRLRFQRCRLEYDPHKNTRCFGFFPNGFFGAWPSLSDVLATVLENLIFLRALASCILVSALLVGMFGLLEWQIYYGGSAWEELWVRQALFVYKDRGYETVAHRKMVFDDHESWQRGLGGRMIFFWQFGHNDQSFWQTVKVLFWMCALVCVFLAAPWESERRWGQRETLEEERQRKRKEKRAATKKENERKKDKNRRGGRDHEGVVPAVGRSDENLGVQKTASVSSDKDDELRSSSDKEESDALASIDDAVADQNQIDEQLTRCCNSLGGCGVIAGLFRR